MLFYLVPASAGPVPPANCWGSPWHTKFLKILRGYTSAASLSKNVTHYFKSCQRGGTGYQNAYQKLTLGSSWAHFSYKILESGPFQNA